MSTTRDVFIVSFTPYCTPSTVDGEWSGTLGAFESEEEAEKMKRHIESNTDPEYDWLGHFSKDGDDALSSNRGFSICVEKVRLSANFEPEAR